MARRRLQRTDLGTVLFHWLIVVFLVLVVATGLRIAADDPDLTWLRAFDPVLPREDLWYWHLLGALAVSAVFGGYIVYIVSARLGQRTRVDNARFAMLLSRGPTRWASLGAILTWLLFLVLALEIVSGVLLYLNQAGPALFIHRNLVWFCLAYPVLHVALHFLYGGLGQLARVFRPTRLIPAPPPPDVLALLAYNMQLVDDMKRGRMTPEELRTAPATHPGDGVAPPSATRPLILGLLSTVAIVAAGIVLGLGSEATLVIPSIPQLGEAVSPVIDGDISDPVWSATPVTTILTDQGANFGDSGQSVVDIRAVHDGAFVYFAFTWTDPTRSLKHLPLVKDVNGWRVARTALASANETQLYEDQFSILISRPTTPVLGAAIHLAPRPLAGYPPSTTGRGLHYLPPGKLVDVWLWRAVHGGLAGYLDDGHFSEPKQPTAEQASGEQQYTGGYDTDPGSHCYPDNYAPGSDPSSGGIVPIRLPLRLEDIEAAMGEVRGSAEVSEADGARWWMTTEESTPYSAGIDNDIAVGTIIPGVLGTCSPAGDVADVRGMAKWSAGRWTLEVVRAIDTGSAQDIPIATGDMLWVAAFDHAATRHTRHIRTVTLVLR